MPNSEAKLKTKRVCFTQKELSLTLMLRNTKMLDAGK